MTVQPETELLSAPPGIAIDALAVLIAIAIAFVIGSWHEIQRLFGL